MAVVRFAVHPRLIGGTPICLDSVLVLVLVLSANLRTFQDFLAQETCKLPSSQLSTSNAQSYIYIYNIYDTGPYDRLPRGWKNNIAWWEPAILSCELSHLFFFHSASWYCIIIWNDISMVKMAYYFWQHVCQTYCLLHAALYLCNLLRLFIAKWLSYWTNFSDGKRQGVKILLIRMMMIQCFCKKLSCCRQIATYYTSKNNIMKILYYINYLWENFTAHSQPYHDDEIRRWNSDTNNFILQVRNPGLGSLRSCSDR